LKILEKILSLFIILVKRLFPMLLIRLAFLLLFSFSFLNLRAQSQDDFTAKMTEVYMAGTDQNKAMKTALELYNMTEKSKELQTYANYYMLETIFRNQAPDEKLSDICKEKAAKLLQAITGTGTANSANVPQDVSNKWYNEIYQDLFKTVHKDNADKAIAFLDGNPSLQNFSNYTYIAYAYERNGDFQNAKKYYEHALTFNADPKTEFLPLNFYTNFLCRSGDYTKAEEYIQKMDKLSIEAIDIFKTSYKSIALTSKTIYFLAVGDYQSFIQSAEEQYDYFQKLPHHSDKHTCDPFSQGRFTLEAYANEMLKHYDLAERQWHKRDSANYVWVDCVNKMVADSNKNYPLSMLPVYLSKRGKRSSLKKEPAYYAKEAETHFNSYKDYSDISINFMKASHYGFLGSAKYHETFQPILKQIKETKNFQESTMPFTHYAYFNMRDRRFLQANENYRQLFELNTGWINDIIFSLGEKAFVTYYNSKLREGYDNFHSFVKLSQEKKSDLLPGLAAQAYNNLLFTKALSLKGVQKRKKTFLDNNDPSVKALYDQWLAMKQEMIRHYHRSSETSMDSLSKLNEQQLKDLQGKVNHLENELTTKARDFKKYLKLETPDWKAVQLKLKEGEAAVEMVRFLWRDQTYYSDTAFYAAYIITRSSPYPDVVYLPDFAEDLDHKYYGFYKNNIKLRLPDKESYNHYWKPVMDKLKGIKKIYFSPDGIYHIVSLHTLQNPETGKFLLEELEIRYTTSTSDLLGFAAPKDIRQAVLIGRPAYKIENFDGKSMLAAADNTRGFVRDFRGNNISDLPGTEEEVLAIKKQMEISGVKASCYLREQAREETVYQVHGPDILHIATHGYWSDAGPDATEGYRVFNAMVNSGLLLSGVVNYYSAEKAPDTYDGILTAYEAQNLDLEHTSLVILSACETSLGHFDAGEGVYGLQRAFRAAGARSIMTSLWKVDDNATKDFMIFFYKNFLLTKDKYAAFVQAQRSLMQKYPEPYYWGAFILSGI
jgi:CHAT domain-containing protein